MYSIMGDIFDYYRDRDMEEDFIFPFIKEHDDDNDPIWTTGKGKYVKLSQMTDLHIINTLKCWLGLGKTKPPKGWCGGKTRWVKILTNEIERRAHEQRRDNKKNLR